MTEKLQRKPHSTPTALIVDDNEVNAAVFEAMLDEVGCAHTTALSGREAVARAAAEVFGVILMDVRMPDMDGWAATKLIRRAEGGTRRTPIIALTANASEDHRRQCLEASMDDFLAKPVIFEKLYAALARWLPREPAAASATTPATTSGISVETLARIAELERRGRVGLFARAATIFVQTSGRRIEAIRAAIAQGDLKRVGAECHAYKSAAAHIGADELARRVIDVEAAARDGNPTRVATFAEGLYAAATAACAALELETARRGA